MKVLRQRAGEALRRSAMTVMELLIVVSIIALLSVLAMPAIRALTRSNTISSANRQLLDDVALARQRAINERSIVHIVFVPPFPEMQLVGIQPGDTLRNRSATTNLWAGSQTRYALYAERSAGDQPGQHHPRYLTGWHTLPEGIFFPEWMLTVTGPGSLERVTVPFPTIDGQPHDLPHIAFDYSGAVIDKGGVRQPQGAAISLARGSVLVSRNPDGTVALFDAKEIPSDNSISNFNRVRIDGLTGRARVERPEIE
jgi:type II secretory pathway pseudopilin PulG